MTIFAGSSFGLSCLICFDENKMDPSSAIRFSHEANKNFGLLGEIYNSLFSSNKLNTKMPHVVCELSQLDTIVTNLDPEDGRLEEYRKSGVFVL